ncbi:hypothetical protein ScPMuIL_008625 [Solemya velum]
MPGWKPDCFRGSTYEPEPVQYRPATEGSDNHRCGQEFDDDRRDIAIVELQKKDGCGLGLTVSGGVDKGTTPRVSSLRPGGIAHRSDALSVGDNIISVNGIRTTGMKHDEIVNLLKNAGERLVLEVEYDLPESAVGNSFSVQCKRHDIVLEKEGNSFGFTLRGGYSTERMKSRPLIVTHIRPGSSADRDGSLREGDKIVAVSDYNITHMSLSETVMFLQQCDQRATFSVEYDISVMEAVQNASGPLLVEIDKVPGAGLGLKLSQNIYHGRRCICVETIRPMRIADRSGALHTGDHILSIDGATVEHMSVAEATQLLKSGSEDQVKLEILPISVIRQQASREAMGRKGLSHCLFLVVNFFPAHHCALPISSYRLRKCPLALLSASPRGLIFLSLVSTATSIVASNQVYHTETLELTLHGDNKGLGITLEGGVFSTEVLGDPPVIAVVSSRSAADRCGVIQEGDRLVRVNGCDLSERTLEEVNQILRECRHQCTVEVEFDIAESVTPSCGTFIVKLPRKASGLGVTMIAPMKKTMNSGLIITQVQRGSVAHRCGSIQAGDHVLALNDLRTGTMSVDDAYNLLQSSEDIVKIKLRREDIENEETEECIMYTVELQRHGGPLGITISGTEDPVDPIIISDLIGGGLAEKTGAIHIGDRLLAVSGTNTNDKTLSETITLLQSAGDMVTLKIARPAETSKPKYTRKSDPVSELLYMYVCPPFEVTKYFMSIDKSSTPIASIDSALESWDSSGPDYGASYNAPSQGQPMVVAVPMRTYPSSNRSEEDWDEPVSNGDVNGEKSNYWGKTFEEMDGQSEMLRQIGVSLRQRSTASLDRRSRLSDGRQHRLWLHSSGRGAVSEDDLDNSYGAFMKSTPSLMSHTSGSQTSHEHFQTVFTPKPIQLHRITLAKGNTNEDFGFGLSDGMFEKGIYVSAIRNGSLAEIAGLKPFDRILQINGKKIKDFSCSKVLPLISQADSWLELIISRCPKKIKSKAEMDAEQRYMNVQEACTPEEETGHYVNVNSTFHSDSTRKTV